MSEIMTTTIKINDYNREEVFSAAYAGSYYTVLGCGGDLAEWTSGYTQLLEEAKIGKPVRFITFNGSDMNTHYGLSGKNAYQEDLTCLMFPLDGLDCGLLAMFRLRAQDKWFDDIVDNNQRREEAGMI
nr:MAG TPA: hypothetical protein [Caudoviricetes sp.]